MSTLATIIYSYGLVHCSVCVPKRFTKDQIEEEVNALSPTGIESKWKVSSDPTFYGGKLNPCPCNDDTEGRLHYLMVC